MRATCHPALCRPECTPARDHDHPSLVGRASAQVVDQHAARSLSRLVALCALLLGLVACGGSATAPTETSAGSCQRPDYIASPTAPLACPSSSDVAEIDAAVRIEFINDPTTGSFVCRAADGSADLTRLQERLYQALVLMKRLRFDTPLPWTDKTLWHWFTDAVAGVRMRASQTFCCESGHVIVLGIGTTYDPGFPKLIEGLVHEARHAESGYPHTCGTGADSTIAELGAYGVQYYLNLWLAEHSGDHLSADDKRYSRNRADWMRYGSFCAECR